MDRVESLHHMPRQQQRQGGNQQQQQARKRLLRVATHNVCGMLQKRKVRLLVRMWMELDVDVICVQETHLHMHECQAVQRMMDAASNAADSRHGGFQAAWACNCQQGAARSAGVALLVRRSLLTEQDMVMTAMRAVPHASGRMLSIPVRWGGHSLHILGVYLPCTEVDQQAFIQSVVQPAVHDRQGCLVLGDWNFVQNAGLDRISLAAGGGVHHAATAHCFTTQCPDLVDVLRQLHPTRRVYTHHGPTSAARLDRVYVSTELQQYVVSCGVGDVPVSDHRPVWVQIGAKDNPLGPGVPRARLAAIWGNAATRLQMQQYIQQASAEAPEDPAALLAWWPGFKGRLLTQCMGLARQARAAVQGPLAQQRTEAANAIQAAFEAVQESTTVEQAAAALNQVAIARQQWCSCVRQQAAAQEWQRRKEWVHAGEHPNPSLTAVLNPHGPHHEVPAMQSPTTGRMVAGGKPLAQLMANFYAQISADPALDAAAVDGVMQAVQAEGLRLDQVVADEVGAATVTEEEVKQALKRTPSGKAPGLDGLPAELWRKCGDVLCPLLAKVFSAIGSMRQLPAGFTDGVITSLFKAGRRCVPVNYRPITLLNTDYRLLAKILACRLKSVQGQVIGMEQTGFLKGRHIGENILVLQLLPHALPTTSKAIAVFLDITKAYDTVARSFLMRLLDAAGLGGGFSQWVQLLLQNTRACANVNGFISSMVQFKAGVRQGCPLAPQLYLFIAQALLSFLKQRGFGVEVRGRRITATQFADDTEVFLDDIQLTPHLLEAMTVFKSASGQALHTGKTKLLAMGKQVRKQEWERYHRERLLLLRSPQQQQQQPLLQRQLQQHQIVMGPRQGRPLGPRAMRVSARSRCAVQDQLHTQAARIVARAVQSEHRQQALWVHRLEQAVALAVRLELQHNPGGMPPDAKYGDLQLVGHATALGVDHMGAGQSSVDWPVLMGKVRRKYSTIAKLRLSMFGRAMACSGYGLSKLLYAAEYAGMPPPAVMSELISNTGKLVDRGQAPGTTKRKFPGVSSTLLKGHPKQGGCGLLPFTEHVLARHALWGVRMMTATSDCPHWVHLARHILTPANVLDSPSWRQAGIYMCDPVSGKGPAGCAVPVPLRRIAVGLRALPQLQDVCPEPLQLGPWCANAPLWCNPWLSVVPRACLEDTFAVFAELGTINTVGQALQAQHDISTFVPHQQYVEHQWPLWFRRNALFLDQQAAQEQVAELVQAIPFAWRNAIQQSTPQQLMQAPSTQQVWDMLWARVGWTRPGGKPLLLCKATVRALTHLQPALYHVAATEKHRAFLQEAAVGLNLQVDPLLAELHTLLRSLWKLPWDNSRKEVFWRLTLDGLPSATRMHMLGVSCDCGMVAPDRQHHFWGCPVAQAVTQTVHEQLPPQYHVLRINVWLCRPPHPTVHAGVWQVVCLAAVISMNKGRQLMYKLASSQPTLSAQQRVVAASKVAVATFWDMLHDFVGVGLCNPSWLLEVGPAHPFLHVVQDAEGHGHLQVNRPQQQQQQ
jgi:exonuclease III